MLRVGMFFALSITLLIGNQVGRADEPEPRPKLIENSVIIENSVNGNSVAPDSGPRGDDSCPGPFLGSHTTTPFQVGSSVNAQGGFLEGEWAAATYVVDPSRFPLRFGNAEILFASPTVQANSETQWTAAVWEGTPTTGNLIAQFSSDGSIIPHLQHPVGQDVAAVINFSVDPEDPEQIIIQNNGSNSFTVGFRVDMHNNQLTGPLGPSFCDVACDTTFNICNGSNMMPSTDTDGLSQPTLNWIFGVSCGGSCFTGWRRFSEIASICRPTGDWMIRANYSCVNLPTGACCFPSNCQVQTIDVCDIAGGTYQGDGTICELIECPVAGACCAQSGGCSVETPSFCTGVLGGAYQGDGTTCTSNPCPQTGACCFGVSCADLLPATCAQVSGVFRGEGSQCSGNTCPEGACCLPDGSCNPSLVELECTAANGIFRGVGSQCATANCPQPTGACCIASSGTCIGGLTPSNCQGIPTGTFAGAGTTCPGACDNDPCDGVALGDYNNSTTIDGDDIAGFTAAFLSADPSQNEICAGDFNANTELDVGDIPGMVAALLQ